MQNMQKLLKQILRMFFGFPDTDRVPPKLAASKAETVLLNTA
jgi:hypothetical protein